MVETISKQDIINSVIEEFSDPKNRAVYKGCQEGTCQYQSDDGNRCAVGMFMTDEALEIYGKSTKSISVLALRVGLDNLIKEEYRDFPVSFWAKIQKLHDNETYWSDFGITQEGLNYVKREIGK